MREHLFQKKGIQHHWLTKVGVFLGLLFVTVASTDPALAHHPMGGATPSTFAQGLFSGIAHPMIGPDHFAAIVALGLLAATKPKGLLIPLAFILAAMVGTGVHLMQWQLPVVELLVSGSILLFGLLLAMKHSPKTLTLVVLSAAAGVYHGFVYGEAIFGAEATPLIAYLVGFTLSQLAVGGGVCWAGHRFFAPQTGQSSQRFRSAGFVLSGVGVAFIATQLVAMVFPT
jgi:urease accessory protein